MPGEKRFRTSFIGGFKKADVNIYVGKILRDFEEKIREKDDEITVLTNQCKEQRAKQEEFINKTQQLEEERGKIAEVLIKAQEKADLMLEEARIEALDEKKQLEDVIEKDKERLVDIRQEMRLLKTEIATVLKKYESQLEMFVTEDNTDDEAEEAG